MLYYCVISKFYDNGRVTANIKTIEAIEKPKDTCMYLKNYDLYKEYFDTETKAKNHLLDMQLCNY